MNHPEDKINSHFLGERIQHILQEQGLRQVDFARAMGVSANYVYLLTSGRKASISRPLAKLIESTYGYSAQWILTGELPIQNPTLERLQAQAIHQLRSMDIHELRAVAAFIHTLEETPKI